VCHAGGLTEVKRIAALCDTFGVSMAPHNPLGPVATMVNTHLGFALPNFLIQEVMRAGVPWRDSIVFGVSPIRDGYVEPSLAPGVGVEIDFKAAANIRFRRRRRPNGATRTAPSRTGKRRWPDGSGISISW
jgi:galactonate dehydratase